MGRLKIKKGVSIVGLQLEMRSVLIAAGGIWKGYGFDLVVTSGLDGEHSVGSYHYYGLAVDLRTRYFRSLRDVRDAGDQLQKKLFVMEPTRDYVVVVEKDHMHVHCRKVIR